MKSLLKAIIYTLLIVLGIYLFFAFWFVVLPLLLFFYIWIIVLSKSNTEKIMNEYKTSEVSDNIINSDVEEIYSDNLDFDSGDEVKELMKDYDLEKDEAEEVVEIMEDYGVDEEDAVSIKEAGI